MGVVYDCFWYWRQEFLGYRNPYNQERGTRPEQEDHLASIVAQNNIQQEADMDPTTLYEDDAFMNVPHEDALFSEWNWSADDSILAGLSQI